MSEGDFLKIYLIAGEASGDLLGAHLMRALRAGSDKPIKFFGVGGERMEAEGLESLFPYYELSMLGFVEVLPYYFNIAARINITVDDIVKKHPDALITIDAPGFNFRVVERLRREKLRTAYVHYVAPTVWVYRPERAELCAKLFDRIMVLLPFEPPYFEKAGLACTWTGHAALAETPRGDGAAFRTKYDIAPDATLFCLMPGSRKGEVERHMPIFRKAISLLAGHFPNLAIVVPVPRNVIDYVTPYFESCPFRAVVIAAGDDKKNAIAASDMAIVKSGTVALEVAHAGIPMLVTYRLHPVSAWMLRRKSLTRYANLVNILKQKEVIPELLQELCTPLMLADAAVGLLKNPARRQRQITQASEAIASLIPQDGRMPSDIAAEAVLATLQTRRVA